MDFAASFREDDEGRRDRLWFRLLLLFLLIDLARIQDVVPVIGELKPGLILSVLLSIQVLKRFESWWSVPAVRLILLFLMLLAAHVPFATNNFYAYQAVRLFLQIAVCVICLVVCVRTIERIRTLVNFLIVILVFVSIYSIVNRGRGTGGFIGDENDLALFINMLLPFCFFLLHRAPTRWEKLLCAAGLICGLSAVVASQSRGGFVGLISVGAFTWLLSPKKLVTFLLIIVLSVGMYYFAGQLYWDEMNTITETSSGTAKERTESWKAAWLMFCDNPLGVGGNNFQIEFPNYQSGYFHKLMWGRVAHSLWFTLLSELGIPGAVLFIFLIYYNLKDTILLTRSRGQSDGTPDYLRRVCLASACSVGGFFACGTFLSVLYYPFYWYLCGIIAACAKVAHGLSYQNEDEDKAFAVSYH